MKAKSMRWSGLFKALAAVLGLVVVIAWLSGWFNERVEPGDGAAHVARASAAASVAPVREVQAPQVMRVVGTIRAVHETAIGSRLLARVMVVNAAAGQRFARGDVLIELDRTDIEARLEQARASVQAAEARLEQAQSDMQQLAELRLSDASTQREFEDARRAVSVSQAELTVRRQAVAEAEAQLDDATIRAPFDGVVIEKQVEVGDLARPGDVMASFYDPDQLQLVAAAPERIALSLAVGQQLDLEIDALGLRTSGAIVEIVPEADAQSRSMLVKTALPGRPDVFSGMFGRLLVPIATETRLVAPARAVRRIGQIEMVRVVGEDRVIEQRVVQTGEPWEDDHIEILTGLAPGDRVLTDFGAG